MGRIAHRSAGECPQSALVVGLAAVFASWIHVPAGVDALDYFDPWKRAVWALAAVLMGLQAVRRRSRMRGTDLPRLLSLTLIAWMLARSLLAQTAPVELGVLCSWCLPPVLFALSLGRTAQREKACRMIALAGVAQALLMLLQRVGWDPFFSGTTQAIAYAPGRMIGTIGFQNQAVDLLGLACAASFGAKFRKSTHIGVVAVMLFTALLSANRGGSLAFVVALGSMLGMRYWDGGRSRSDRVRIMAISAAAVLAVACLALALAPEARTRFASLLQSGMRSASVGSRVYMARVGWDMFAESPLLGWGAGQYAYQYMPRLGCVVSSSAPHEVLRVLVYAREAHNDLLQMAAEFGMLGLLLVAVLVVALVMRLRKTPGQSGAIVPVGTLLYMSVASFVSFPWQTAMAGPLAGALLGLYWPVPEPGHSSPVQQANTRYRAWRTAAYGLLASVALACLLWEGLVSYLSLALPRQLSAGACSKADRIVPRFAHRQRALVGACYAKQNQPARAERELRAAELGFRDVLLWNNLGNSLCAQGKWSEAVTVYQAWVACGLDNRRALANLSVAYEQLAQLERAAATLGREIGMWPPGTPEQLKRLAVLLIRIGDPGRACHVLESSRDVWTSAPNQLRAEVANALGAAYLARGDSERATQAFREALTANPLLKSARLNLRASESGAAGNSTARRSAVEQP